MGAIQQVLLAGGGVSVTAGALDSYTTNLWACYGITRQRSSAVYSGSAIRVRKSTGGDTTTEQDIGFSGTALDTSALSTFGGSETVVVTKFYDQSGNSRDLVQATAGKQPRIVSAGVYDGFIRFDGSDDEFATSSSSGTPSVFSVAQKITVRANTPTQVLYANGTGTGGQTLAQVYVPTGANQIDVYLANTAGSVSDAVRTSITYPWTERVGTIHQLGAASGALTCRLWLSGAAELALTSGAVRTGSFTAQTWRVGSGGGANYCLLNLYSFAMWEANMATDMQAITAAIA